jgi:hypothetical protein
VLSGVGCGGTSTTQGSLVYNRNKLVYALGYDDDIRVECNGGIHFFMTRREAEEWG